MAERKWILITHRAPRHFNDVFLSDGDAVGIGYLGHDSFTILTMLKGTSMHAPTHWAVIDFPPPPKVGNNGTETTVREDYNISE